MARSANLDLTVLRRLHERVLAASGPSRDLDYDIAALVEEVEGSAKAYSSSFDAALSLIKQRLPGWTWTCGTWFFEDETVPRCHAVLSPWRDSRLAYEFEDGFSGDRDDGNVVLGLLGAVLAALIAVCEREATIADP